MAFGVIHYSFLVTSIILVICTIVLLYRYIQIRNSLTLFFTIFMISYAVNAALYFLRGLYEPDSPEELLLWLLTNVMYVVMTIPLALFFAHPLYTQNKDNAKGKGILAVMGIFVMMSVFNFWVIFTSEIVPTYIDPYNLPHYRFDHLVPYAYYITLLFDVTIAWFSAAVLALMAYREQESFYKQRALTLLSGWLIATLGQLLLLIPTTAVITPFTSILAAFLIAGGVLRRPPE